jgi:predicted nucleic acid-binding protein
MSGASVGLDTNILVYTVDNRDAALCRRAQELVELAVGSGRCVIALQSVGEFYAAVTRRGLQPPDQAARQARDWMYLLRVVDPVTSDAAMALEAAAAGRLSYWDGLLLATLRRSGCTTLLSEDMQDGATHDGVTLCNPFVGDQLPGPVAALFA